MMVFTPRFLAVLLFLILLTLPILVHAEPTLSSHIISAEHIPQPYPITVTQSVIMAPEERPAHHEDGFRPPLGSRSL